MSNTISAQHPAVVVRSSYRFVRALLAIATIAIVGLTIALVLLASSNGTSTSVSPTAHATRPAISSNPVVQPNPDEQAVAVTPTPPASNSSYDYTGHY
jgi:ABC-type lipoprotein release transport system permease subunit